MIDNTYLHIIYVYSICMYAFMCANHFTSPSPSNLEIRTCAIRHFAHLSRDSKERSCSWMQLDAVGVSALLENCPFPGETWLPAPDFLRRRLDVVVYCLWHPATLGRKTVSEKTSVSSATYIALGPFEKTAHKYRNEPRQTWIMNVKFIKADKFKCSPARGARGSEGEPSATREPGTM